MAIPGNPDVAILKDLPLCQIRSSQPNSIDPPIQDILKYLEKVVRTPQLDHSTLQRVLRALQRWLTSVSGHETVKLAIVPVLAKVFDALLQKDYGKSDILNLLLDILFLVEDIGEVTGGKEACGYYFISRLLAVVPTKLASVNFRRAAVETLCVLITRCSANQQALLERRTDCLLLFNFLLPRCGDFQLQASIVEISYRLSRRDPGIINSIKDETLKRRLQSLLEVKRPNLLAEIRNLVMSVNNSMGQFRSVYSFANEWVKINGRTVTAIEDKWVDFGKTNFSFHALSEPVSAPSAAAPGSLVTPQEDSYSQIFDILYVDIVDIRESTAKQLEIIVNEQNNLQSPVKDQVLRGEQMHIQFSFAEEDICLMLKCVFSKILPIRTKASSIKSSEDISSRRMIWKSSQGIMIPLHSSKDNARAPNERDAHPPFPIDSVKSASCSAKVASKNISEKKCGQTGAKMLCSEHTATVGLGTKVDENPTKNLSPYSQIIEEALSSYNVNETSPVLQCEAGKEASAVPMNNFKVPAAKSKSMNDGDSQSAAQNLQKENSVLIAPLKEVAGMSVQQKETQSRSTSDAFQHRHLHLKPGCSPPRSSPVGRFHEKSVAIVLPIAAGLNDDGRGNVVQDRPSVVSDRRPKLDVSHEKEGNGSGLPKQAEPVVTQERVFTRKHKQNVVSGPDGDYEQGRKKSMKCTENSGNHQHTDHENIPAIVFESQEKKSKRLNDRVESNSEKPNGKMTVSAPKLHEDFLSKLEELDKRPRRNATKNDAVASFPKTTIPTLEVATNTRSVYSFSGESNFHDGNRKRGRRKEAMEKGPKSKKSILNSNITICTAALSASPEKVPTAKRPRGRPRKVGPGGTSHQVLPDAKNDQEYSASPPEKVPTAKRLRGRSRKVDALGTSHQVLPDSRNDQVYTPSPPQDVLDLRLIAAEENRIQQEHNKPSSVASEKRASSPSVSLRQENVADENPISEPLKAVLIEKICTRPCTEDLGMTQKSKSDCEKRITLPRGGSPLKQKESEQVSWKLNSPVANGLCVLPSPHIASDNEVLEAPDRTKGLATRRNTMTSSNNYTRLNKEVAVDHTSADSIPPCDSAKFHAHGPKFLIAQADVKIVCPNLEKSNDSSGSFDEGSGPIEESEREPPKDNVMISSTKKKTVLMTSEAKLDDPYSISSPSIGRDKLEYPVAARAHRPASDDSKTRVARQLHRGDELRSSKDNVLISSTKRKAALVTPEAKLDNPYSISPSLVRDKLESPVAVRAHKPAGDSKTRVTPQLLRNDKLGSPVCTPIQQESNLQAIIAKGKNPPSNSRGRPMPEQRKEKESMKMQLFKEVAESTDHLKDRNRAAEQERDVDIYYSTPVSAGRKRRTLTRISSDLASGRVSSELAESDEAFDPYSTFKSKDWGRGFMTHTQHRRRVHPYRGKGSKEIANSEPRAQTQSSSKVQLPEYKLCEGPKAKFASLAARNGDGIMQDRAKQGRPDSFSSPDTLPRKLPACKGSKGPKVKFTSPLTARDGDDSADRAKQGRSNSSSSSESLPRMKSRGTTNCDFENEDDDGGLTRSVVLVEKMLEKFRRKVELQVKQKTNKVLDNVLLNLESEVNSFEARIQKDLDDFVNICTTKFENLEAKRQAQIEKGRIWQEKIAQEFKVLVQESKDIVSNVKVTEAELRAMAEKQRTGHKGLLCQLQETLQQTVENADRKISAIKKNADQLHGLRDILKGWV